MLNGAAFDNTMFMGIILDNAMGSNAAEQYYNWAHFFAFLGYALIAFELLYGVLLLRRGGGPAVQAVGRFAGLYALFVSVFYLIQLLRINLYLADGFYGWYPFNTTYQFTVPPFLAWFTASVQLRLAGRKKGNFQTVESSPLPAISPQVRKRVCETVRSADDFGGWGISTATSYVFDCEDGIERRLTTDKKELRNFAQGDSVTLLVQGYEAMDIVIDSQTE